MLVKMTGNSNLGQKIEDLLNTITIEEREYLTKYDLGIMYGSIKVVNRISKIKTIMKKYN
jgi:hypothetical protein